MSSVRATSPCFSGKGEISEQEDMQDASADKGSCAITIPVYIHSPFTFPFRARGARFKGAPRVQRLRRRPFRSLNWELRRSEREPGRDRFVSWRWKAMSRDDGDDNDCECLLHSDVTSLDSLVAHERRRYSWNGRIRRISHEPDRQSSAS